jgi:hypothetical protein
MGLLLHDDGHLSLSKLQMAWWSVLVAVVMVYFGGIRLEMPEPPESLIVLMGMSLLTTGISYKSAESVAAAAAVGAQSLTWQWVDLIRTADGVQQLSLARAQMLIWTVLISGMFIAKSVLTGQLWPIPWQLVGLMGVSQAGYVIPKVASS